MDPGKALDAINLEAGTVGTSAHKLRHTFASIPAGTRVSAFALTASSTTATAVTSPASFT